MSRFGSIRAAVLTCGLLVLTSGLGGCSYNAYHEKQLGRAEMDQGAYAAARERFYEVTQQSRADWEGHYYLGLCDLELGEPVRAETALRQALAVMDSSDQWTPRILDAVAQSQYDQNEIDRLYAFLRAQIDYYGTWHDYARQARYLALVGDIDGAALAYRKAAYFSKNATEEIYIEIADFYESIGDQPHAVQSLKWAYWINPKHTQLPERFRKYGLVPGPTLREPPPTPAYAGDQLFAF